MLHWGLSPLRVGALTRLPFDMSGDDHQERKPRSTIGTAMALSKDEQRTLEEIERALLDDDPKFAASVNLDQVRHHRAFSGGLGFLLGLALLLVGAIATQAVVAIGVVVSVAGFLVMIAALARLFGWSLHD